MLVIPKMRHLVFLVFVIFATCVFDDATSLKWYPHSDPIPKLSPYNEVFNDFKRRYGMYFPKEWMYEIAKHGHINLIQYSALLVYQNCNCLFNFIKYPV